MKNPLRGEAGLVIDGRAYAVVMTLDVLARLADELGVTTLGELEARLLELRIGDMRAVLRVLLEGCGHAIPADRLARVSHRAYIHLVRDVWNARVPDAEEDEGGTAEVAPSPRKRAT